MQNRIRYPVIITTLAFAAMVIVFVAHFRLTREEAGVAETAVVTRSDVDVAAPTVRPVVETPDPVTVAPQPEPPSAPVSYEEAEAAFSEGRYQDAVDLFTAYTERESENPWGFYMLGLSASRTGDIETAEPAFERAIELDPGHVKSYINLGRALLDAGRPTYALVRIHEAIALDPQSARAHRLEGVALYDIGKRGEAESAFRKALEIDGEDAWAMNNLALLYIEEGRPDEALRALARATALRDDVAVFFNNLGMALELAGRFGQATEAYDRAAAIDGGYTKAIDNYNRVATVLEDPSLAPVDLAALGDEFAAEVEGWDETVVAAGVVEEVKVAEPDVGTTADSTATDGR